MATAVFDKTFQNLQPVPEPDVVKSGWDPKSQSRTIAIRGRRDLLRAREVFKDSATNEQRNCMGYALGINCDAQMPAGTATADHINEYMNALGYRSVLIDEKEKLIQGEKEGKTKDGLHFVYVFLECKIKTKEGETRDWHFGVHRVSGASSEVTDKEGMGDFRTFQSVNHLVDYVGQKYCTAPSARWICYIEDPAAGPLAK